jgi:ornithine carbamoyltransferase
MEHGHGAADMTALTQRVAVTAPAPTHVLSAADLGGLGLDRLLARAESFRQARRDSRLPSLLAGRQVALLFEKPSLRTRVSFEVGVTSLGGNAIYLGPDEVGLGTRESPTDIGQNLSRWVDAIVVRTYAHGSIVELAAASSIPIINGLTDLEHPCQALADLLTLRQRLGVLRGRTVAFVGDGNNVCQSLVLAAVQAGIGVRVATPNGYAPNATVVATAQRIGRLNGASVEIGTDPAAAVSGVDAVYTDVWTSMGAEAEAEERRARFAGFRVDADLLAGAPGALVMHCLPAHRGEEISAEALDGPQSVALDQAENRLYAQQALLVELIDRTGP